MNDRADQVTELVNEIFLLNGRLMAVGDRWAGAVGLTAARWLVLGGLADEPLTVSALARRRGLRRQSVQESINRLLRDGMVARIPNPADRRAPLFRLTPAAHRALAQIDSSRREWALHWGEGFGDLDVLLADIRASRERLEPTLPL